MLRRLLCALHARARILLRRRLAGVAAGEPAIDVLRDPAVADTSGAAAQPSLGAMFCAGPHRSSWPHERLDAEIRARAQRIDALQPGYQPVFGFAEFPAKRTEHLERNVAIVQDLLKPITQKHQVRILDVGCNLGYVALRIAQTCPNVVGLEISAPHLELCRLLAARHGSSARFFSDDALALLASGQDDFENVDVVLLYNVVHQFIFSLGFAPTKALLARLASRVDTLIVELALRSDYVKHGKDHLLPERPEDVLADCSDVEIVRLHETPRPVYRIRRKSARFGSIEVRPVRIEYSPNPDPRVSRKYYTGGEQFLKLYRFDQPGDRAMFEHEVTALLKLRDTDVAPRLLDWVATPRSGALLMSRVHGERLVPRLYLAAKPPTPAERMALTREYLRVAKAVHDAVGFQNDLQPHNLLWTRHGQLVLVDYEQAGPTATNDPFGLLLWSVFDLWGGRDPGRPAAIRTLRRATEDGAEAGSPAPTYPAFDALELPPEVAALVAEAACGGDWGMFVTTWAARLGAPAAAGAASS